VFISWKLKCWNLEMDFRNLQLIHIGCSVSRFRNNDLLLKIQQSTFQDLISAEGGRPIAEYGA